ncbi:hypothetical protein [Catenuloplanes indicus]|uniref:Fibronectin type-III domain-containing protein n=1 Tax=Catenuloplanes indicus TaxID=137267 RepID=A0AAE3VVH5_9ACTN|nr:hypothetical protein [Catenuloplanes indicus]MDQ0363967.1 hypothetical protein [Catenuloplanes indicus]
MRTRAMLVIAAVLAAVLVPLPASAAVSGSPPPHLFADDFADQDLAGWQPVGSWEPATTTWPYYWPNYVRGTGRLEIAGSSGWTDYGLQTSYVYSPGTGLVLRAQPDGRHYRLVIRYNAQVAIEYVAADGTAETLALYTGFGAGAWQGMSFQVKGDLLAGQMLGIPVPVTLYAHDTRLPSGAGGLTDGSFDDVTAESFETPAPGTPDTHHPKQPAHPRVQAADPGYATVAWDPAVDDTAVTEYAVYRSGDYHAPGVLVGTAPAAGSLRVPREPTGFSFFTIAARDAAGNESPVSVPAVLW